MTSDTRTPDEIERDIVAERSRLAGSINQLQEKFSMETIMRDLSEGLRGQSAEIARVLGRTVSRNPTAAIMAGAGLAWLLFGKGTSSSSYDRGDYSRDWPRHNAGAPGQAHDSLSDRMHREWGAATMPNGSASGGIRDGLAAGARKLREGVEAATDWVSDTAASLTGSAVSLREKLSKGTEDLSEEARERVIAAREAAWKAQEGASDMAKKGAAAATDFFEEQPLVVGALAVAVGAAIGGLMPRTRIEDETIGAERDALFEEAQRIFEEEKAKVANVASAAASEAGKVMREMGDTVRDRADDLRDVAKSSASSVEDAARRVAGSAQDAARAQTGNH